MSSIKAMVKKWWCKPSVRTIRPQAKGQKIH